MARRKNNNVARTDCGNVKISESSKVRLAVQRSFAKTQSKGHEVTLFNLARW